MIDEHAYSTMMDAILFLAMVSMCALILSPAIFNSSRERAVSDAYLRDMASSSLRSMAVERVDFFEYRILGDQADSIARSAGIDPQSELYSGMTAAVLGRGSRHKTVMDILAEVAACRQSIRLNDGLIALNPLTVDYDARAAGLADSTIRRSLDDRYAYNFSIRWTPYANVPFEGSFYSGSPVPEAAESSSAYVCMPYTTEIDGEYIEKLIGPELREIRRLTILTENTGDEESLRDGLRTHLHVCLVKMADASTAEVLNYTAGRIIKNDDPSDPLRLLKSFAGSAPPESTISPVLSARSILPQMVVEWNRPYEEILSEHIASGVIEGTVDGDEAADMIVRWLRSIYDPSRGRACLCIWVDDHAL